ncbi:MAG: RND family transporter, partial [Gammaproteobacteria bacterium]
MSDAGIVDRLEGLIFNNRKIVIGLFVLITIFMAYTAATQLRIDTAYSKQLPTKHEYMQTFRQYFDQFGGADRVLVAVSARDGDMFDAKFFETLKNVTDAVFFIPGVDRPKVMSLYTPNVRYLEVVEDGIEAGNVIDADFAPTPEGLAKVR